jgi:hypothetical protein
VASGEWLVCETISIPSYNFTESRMAKPSKRIKSRGYSDRRGFWAESDCIAVQFVPNERHRTQQKMMAQTLIAAGLKPEQIAEMLSVPVEPPAPLPVPPKSSTE